MIKLMAISSWVPQSYQEIRYIFMIANRITKTKIPTYLEWKPIFQALQSTFIAQVSPYQKLRVVHREIIRSVSLSPLFKLNNSQCLKRLNPENFMSICFLPRSNGIVFPKILNKNLFISSIMNQTTIKNTFIISKIGDRHGTLDWKCMFWICLTEPSALQLKILSF